MILGDKQNISLVLSINRKKIKDSREIELYGIFIDNQNTLKTYAKKLYLNFMPCVEYAKF